MKRRPLIGLLLAATAGTLACGGPSLPETAATPEDSVSLTVSAAASVQDAMTDIQTAYGEVAPQVSLTYNFGSSGSLAQQIAQGAPSDVFLSASERWMDDLEAKQQILAGSRRDLLQNDIVLVVPEDGGTVANFPDLGTASGKVAMGEPESVPAGQYAKEVLTALNLFDSLQSRLVFGKDVRQVLSYVETGNVEAGLVYATDAQVSDRVRVVAIAPPDTHAPIVYPVAVVDASTEAEAAQAFVDFLSSDTAVNIFQGYGFAMVD